MAIKKPSKLAFIIAIIVAVALLVAALATAAIIDRNNKDGKTGPTNGEVVTVEGEYVCLPKEGPGPHTMECTYGLKATDDIYYGLNFMGIMSEEEGVAFSYDIGDRLRVIGVFEEADEDDIYTSIGTIEIESIEPLE